jgi:hypothetical protein
MFIYSKLPYNTGNMFLKWGTFGESVLDFIYAHSVPLATCLI